MTEISTPGGHQPEVGEFVEHFRRVLSLIIRPRKLERDDLKDEGQPPHESGIEVLYRNDGLPLVLFRAVTKEEKEVTVKVDMNLALSNNMKASEGYILALLTHLEEGLESERMARAPIILQTNRTVH